MKVPVRLRADDVTLTDAIRCSILIDYLKGLGCWIKIQDPEIYEPYRIFYLQNSYFLMQIFIAG